MSAQFVSPDRTHRHRPLAGDTPGSRYRLAAERQAAAVPDLRR